MTPHVAPFAPARLLAHRHAQTIFPALFRRGGPSRLLLESWPTPDGETVDVERLPDRPGRPGVLVLHGLEGSSRARYVRGLLAAVEARGWNGAAMNFRSCGPTPLRGRQLYHSGDTRDLPLVAARLSALWGGAPLGGVGFSMGGNALLKWLGESGPDAPVTAAVAVSVPYDLAACAGALDGPGLLAAVYRERFLRTLRRKAAALAARCPGILDAEAVRRCRTFAAYDQLVTAPVFGFAGARDYWARCSSAGFVAAIRRPALLLAAEDDPFIPAAALPRAAIAGNPVLSASISPCGGHVGFVAGSALRPVYEVDARALAFLARHLEA